MVSLYDIERFAELCIKLGVTTGKWDGVELTFAPRIPTVEPKKKDDKPKPDKRPDGMAAALAVGDE